MTPGSELFLEILEEGKQVFCISWFHWSPVVFFLTHFTGHCCVYPAVVRVITVVRHPLVCKMRQQLFIKIKNSLFSQWLKFRNNLHKILNSISSSLQQNKKNVLAFLAFTKKSHKKLNWPLSKASVSFSWWNCEDNNSYTWLYKADLHEENFINNCLYWTSFLH